MNINCKNLKNIMVRAMGNKHYSKNELYEFAGIIKAATDYLEDEIMSVLAKDTKYWEQQHENNRRKLEPKVRLDQTSKLMDVITHCTYQ